MVVHWTGWGWTAFFIPLALLVPAFIFVFSPGVYDPDPHQADRQFDLLIALWMLLSAASIFVIERWREAKARRVARDNAGPFVQTVRNDTFLWMRLWVWPYVFLFLSLCALVASFFA